MTDPLDGINPALADRYAIERELGRGGMATVYLARDLRHDRQVAVKVLHAELAEAIGVERFLREIRTTANLSHPHILPLFDSGEAEGFLYYVMPLVEGESLQDRLDREGQLPVDEAVQMAEIDLTVPAEGQSDIELFLPIWSPGFCRIQDYASKVEEISTQTADREALSLEAVRSNRWRVLAVGHISG